MSKGIRYANEFKQDAVAQVVERGFPLQITYLRALGYDLFVSGIQTQKVVPCSP